MPLYTLHRNYLHSSTLGVVSFVKGEETMVPPILEREIIAIGGRRVEGDSPDVLDAEKAAPIPLSFDERRDKIFTAFKLLVETNESKDFTAAGVPTVSAVNKLTGLDADRAEVVELWAEFRVLADEAK